MPTCYACCPNLQHVFVHAATVNDRGDIKWSIHWCSHDDHKHPTVHSGWPIPQTQSCLSGIASSAIEQQKQLPGGSGSSRPHADKVTKTTAQYTLANPPQPNVQHYPSLVQMQLGILQQPTAVEAAAALVHAANVAAKSTPPKQHLAPRPSSSCQETPAACFSCSLVQPHNRYSLLSLWPNKNYYRNKARATVPTAARPTAF
jgi:hypothetical protein